MFSLFKKKKLSIELILETVATSSNFLRKKCLRNKIQDEFVLKIYHTIMYVSKTEQRCAE